MRAIRLVVGIMVVCFVCSARAAEVLPERCFQDDVMLVVCIDGEKANAAEVQKAAKAIFADKDAAARDFVRAFQQMQPLFDAGVARMVMVMPRLAADGRQVAPVLYMAARPGATDDAIRNAFARLDRNTPCKREGDWITARPSGGSPRAPVPQTGGAEVMKQAIADAGQQPLVICWAIGPEAKDIAREFGKAPEPLHSAITAGLDARSLAFGASGGDAPTMSLRLRFGKPEGAARAAEAYAKVVASDAAMMQMFKPVLELVKPERKEEVLEISLSPQQLASAGRMLGPILEQQRKEQEAAMRAAIEAQQKVMEAQRKALAEADPIADATAAHMRLILQQIRVFDEQRQAMPEDLDELVASGLVPDAGQYELRNPKTDEERGFVYQKPANVKRLVDIKDAAGTAILYEAINGEINSAGLVGYADGHVAKTKQ